MRKIRLDELIISGNMSKMNKESLVLLRGGSNPNNWRPDGVPTPEKNKKVSD
ncbi:MAG: hypothetical protein AAFQ94_30965 [Bacteroidota bacterium]